MENYQNEQTNKVTYSADIVFCIDVTFSMHSILNLVKKNALNFYNDIISELRKKRKSVDKIRIRVIAFRDYIADGENAMLVTDFFDMPFQTEDFSECVNSLEASGGGDEPEDGLEALAYAIRSKWSTEGIKKRNIIVVWTDASTHELGFGKGEELYPKNMAKDFDELTEWWGYGQENSKYISQSAKRLILFAPDAPYWNEISDSWDNVIHYPSRAGEGLQEFDYKQILDVIGNSI